MTPKKSILFILLALLLTACEFSLAADVTPPPGYRPPVEETQEPAAETGPLYPIVAPNPADGEVIYAEKCAPCHGDQGFGDGPNAAELPNPVTPIGDPQVARAASPADWYRIVSEGNLERFMPPFRSLTTRQRWDVVAYVFGLSTSPDTPGTGRLLYDENCAACHGPEGRGNGEQASALGTDLPDFTDPEWMSTRSSADFFQAISAGMGDEMPAFEGELGEEQRWLLSDYLRSLTLNPADDLLAQQQSTLPETEVPLEMPDPAAAITSTNTMSETAALVETDGVGTIVGVVNNATGGEMPVGAPVTLHGFDEMQNTMTLTTTLETDGTFRFENVEMPAGRVFMATVKHQGATYGSDIFTASGKDTNLEIPITVYNTTTDPSVLSVDRLHLFFEYIDENTLQVVELYVISNTSERTLVAEGEGEPTVRYSLPQGATNLQIQDGELGGRYVPTEEGFGDTVSIRPGSGSYQAIFAFEMPYDREIDLAQKMELPAQAVVAMAPEGSMQIEGENLQDGGVEDVQGTMYRIYNSPSLEAGDTLRLTVSGRAPSGAAVFNPGDSLGLLVGASAFGLALILAGVWLYRRNTADREVEDNETGPYADEETEDEASIMDAILALDDQYRAGELQEDAYRQRRAELKARLKEMMKL
jgi:mono/diheme cytochrome c family protein